MRAKPVIKAVIFDLDGTLLDTIADIAGAMNRVLEDMGHPKHSIDAYKGFVGHGQTQLVTNALPQDQRTPENITIAAAKFWDYYDIEWYLHTRTYPGVLYMIQLAVARKIKVAILSNKAHYFTKKMICHFFRGAMIRHVKNPFGVYSGEQPGVPTKPDPTLALQLAERMNVKPNTIAIVGDMPVDIQTAKNGGMIPIGAAWGFSSREALKAAGARMIFDSPGDLATYLVTMPLV
jgi:phosphoglycolate phosphatase